MSWWWCLKHMRVEDDSGCAHAERLGPYESEQEAGLALQRARERTEALDAEEAAEDPWRDDRGR